MLDSDDSFSNPPVYKDGDIVWVKLGGCWWPGVVKNLEDLPEDLLKEFKKPPLVVVKFFDEDSYEYIRNWGNIYPYNSSKKNDFIKKGMAAYRSKISHMSKFPKDVTKAEELTNGNPNILSDPIFLPTKKFNYTELFGAPTPKKTKTGKTPVRPKKTSQKQNTSHITHRRFLGHDDYQAFMCIQYPGKDRGNNSDEEMVSKLKEEPEQQLNCQTCLFKTKRLEVMILHAKMHITDSVKKKAKKFQSERTDSGSESKKSPKQRQRRKKPVAKKKNDTFTDLLNEWSDTDEQNEQESSKRASNGDKEDEDNEDSDVELKTATKETEKVEDYLKEITKFRSVSRSPKPTLKSKTYEDIKNCFDFDEDDEEEEIAVTAAPGRKIPRVIPEKTASDQRDILESEDDSLQRRDGSSNSEKLNEPVDDNLENIFKEVMEETAVPNLGELIHTLKPEQNFHDGRTVKFPDKGISNESESKPINPKKRFVKSFEDFELELRKKEENEQLGRYFGDVGEDEVCDSKDRCEISRTKDIEKSEILKNAADADIKLVLEETVEQIIKINEETDEKIETGQGENNGKEFQEVEVFKDNSSDPQKKNTRRKTKHEIISKEIMECVDNAKSENPVIESPQSKESAEPVKGRNTRRKTRLTQDFSTCDKSQASKDSPTETVKGRKKHFKEVAQETSHMLEEIPLETGDKVIQLVKERQMDHKESSREVTQESFYAPPEEKDIKIPNSKIESANLADAHSLLDGDIANHQEESDKKLKTPGRRSKKPAKSKPKEHKEVSDLGTPRTTRRSTRSVYHSVETETSSKVLFFAGGRNEAIEASFARNVINEGQVRRIIGAEDSKHAIEDSTLKFKNVNKAVTEEGCVRTEEGGFAKTEKMTAHGKIEEGVTETENGNNPPNEELVINDKTENASRKEPVRGKGRRRKGKHDKLEEVAEKKQHSENLQQNEPEVAQGGDEMEQTKNQKREWRTKADLKTPVRSALAADFKPGRRTRNSEEVRVLEEALKQSAETAQMEALERERKVSESNEFEEEQHTVTVDIAKYKKNKYSELIISGKEAKGLQNQVSFKKAELKPLAAVSDVRVDTENRERETENPKAEQDPVRKPEIFESPKSIDEPKRGRAKRLSIEQMVHDDQIVKDIGRLPPEDILQTVTSKPPDDITPSDIVDHKGEEFADSKVAALDFEEKNKPPGTAAESHCEKAEDKAQQFFPFIEDVSQIPLPPGEPVQRSASAEDVEDKSMPPKKSRWSRRNSHPKKDKRKIEDSLREAVLVGECRVETVYDKIKLDEIPLPDDVEPAKPCEEPKVMDANDDSEIILPLKKSRRLNELTLDAEVSPVKSKIEDDLLNFSVNDTSLMSTSLKNAVQNAIESIDADRSNKMDPAAVENSEPKVSEERKSEDGKKVSELFKCMPPKKKKVELPLEQPQSEVEATSHAQAPKHDAEDIPQPPKKKIQKIFENSQASAEKSYVNDVPQMSPLAKKKSFAFQEVDDSSVEVEQGKEFGEQQEKSDLEDSAAKKHKMDEQLDVDTDETIKRKRIAEHQTGDQEPGEIEMKQSDLDDQDSICREVVEEEVKIVNQVGTEQRETSSAQELYLCTAKPAGLEEETITVPSSENDVTAPPPVEEEVKTVVPPLEEGSVPISAITKEVDDHQSEMEVDFKFSIQTNLTNLKSSNTEELSALGEATLCEIKGVKENAEEKKVDDSGSEQDVPAESLVKSPIVPPPDPSELVTIEGNLTVMSEKDLADAQVEITTDKVISEKKPLTLSSFSMDYSESSDSGSAELLNRKSKVPEDGSLGDSSGTEFSLKAMIRAIDHKPLVSRPNTYERTELLDILEGNSNSNSSSSSTEQKFKKSFDSYSKKDVVQGVQGICDFEECIPSQIVLSNKTMPESVDSPKLLERLSIEKPPQKVVIQSDVKVPENVSKMLLKKLPKGGIGVKNQKFVIKAKPNVGVVKTVGATKPIILSEQIIRPATSAGPSQGVKRTLDDIEDVEAFIIPKATKKAESAEEPAPSPATKKGSRVSGKAKILQQTIITPEGEIIQPQTDDSIFDINSMPIVLSDEILTPENIESMPVVISNEVIQTTQQAVTTKGVLVKEKATPTLASRKMVVAPAGKMVIKQGAPVTASGSTQQVISTPKQPATKPRIISGNSSRVLKQAPSLVTGSGKPTKYILLPSAATQGVVQQGKVVGTKQVIRKQAPAAIKMPGAQPELGAMTGNKIMIVTNQQGQQHRLLLTPAQQKMLGVQSQPTKVTKTIVKGPIPKGLLQEATPGPSGVGDKILPQKTTVIATSSTIPDGSSGLLMPATKTGKPALVKKPVAGKIPGQKMQKTILIKNQHGQTVKKIQGTDEDELDRQVAEQLEAIKASARLQQSRQPELITYGNRGVTVKATARRAPYPKKPEPVKPKPTSAAGKATTQPNAQAALPLKSQLVRNASEKEKAPETGHKPEASRQMVESDGKTPATLVPQTITAEGKPERPLNQLVIQDALGNQTTITEGQILALPSETVDGQPQSYMLITLDESGNLTPLNNEALMSLDPSLGLGGDVNNMVLQVDQGQGVITPASAVMNKTDVASAPIITDQQKVAERLKGPIIEPKELNQAEPKPAMKKPTPTPPEPQLPAELQVSLTDAAIGDPMGGQQLIVTGDPVVTQKFLESLSDGTTDLATILANADGGSLLIQADGQQILIKTNSADATLLMDPSAENTEGAGNPIFSTQHKPNQDILAAALANTDVFQQQDPPGVSGIMKSLPPSQLSPGGGALYPMNVGNVLETSLTLSSPIMTPLEVPSISGKKIDDEADILGQVPKNVDLPITITDPNISQTVAHQQATGLMELSLPISEATVVSTDMNSPSFSYSLPAIEDSVEISSQKPFNGSMPLLTEDVVEETVGDDQKNPFEGYGSLPVLADDSESNSQGQEGGTDMQAGRATFEGVTSLPLLTDDVVEGGKSPKSGIGASAGQQNSYEESGLCTLGGEMCSSLSEPPPDMFDLGPVAEREEEISSDQSSVPEAETMSLNSEGSGEIPLQPHIVATLAELKRTTESDGHDAKRPKFD
ncbi:titin-like isoform X2 [Cylas formicarius]|uniref:titin-like isoform X2 n=1 Tax=Cylas formicarius TaxID=197179 RepID=UPI0029585B5F|nr:titin-like isoform X2 [Cylas formicarius]